MKIREFAIAAAIIYIVVATTVYRLEHPDMSETRLFMNLHNALLFRSDADVTHDQLPH